MSGTVVLLLVVAVALGALAQGATGIGFGLLVAPVCALVLEPGEVVGTVARLGLLVDLLLVAQGRAAVDRRVVANYIGPALLAVPVSLVVVSLLPGNAVVVGVGLLTLAGAATLAAARPVPDAVVVAGGQVSQRLAGFAAGFMGIAAGMPGPPVAIEAARRHAPPAQARATLAVLFVVVDAAAVLTHPRSVPVVTGVALAVAALVGLAAARWLSGRLDPVAVRRALLVLIVTSALAALGRALA